VKVSLGILNIYLCYYITQITNLTYHACYIGLLGNFLMLKLLRHHYMLMLDIN